MFRLSKLGQEFGNEFFMDSEGNHYKLISEPNKPRRVGSTFVLPYDVYERAKAHPDWDADTMELS